VYFSLKLALGAAFTSLLLSFPVLFILPLFALIGGLVWSFFTIQHVNAMKKCKCPDSIAEEFTYGFAIIRLVAFMVGILLLANVFLIYNSMNEKERKDFAIGFKKGFIQRLKNQSKN
jgi:large-conductance mechanosensitive channel